MRAGGVTADATGGAVEPTAEGPGDWSGSRGCDGEAARDGAREGPREGPPRAEASAEREKGEVNSGATGEGSADGDKDESAERSAESRSTGLENADPRVARLGISRKRPVEAGRARCAGGTVALVGAAGL